MKSKILIVNDRPDMLMLLDMLIKKMTPYETVFTNNPLEVSEIMKEEDIDCVIAEFEMPVLDGNGLLNTVRAIDRDIPVIITSDYSDVETALDAMHKGAFDFIVKPFRQERILFAIGNALKLRKLKKENNTLKKQLKILASEAVPQGARNS